MEIQRYAIKVKAQPLPLFETPVGFGEISNAESLLDDLATAIKANKAASSGIKRSNEGGWHSNTDMLEWGGEAARKVADTAISIAKRMSHFEEASVDDFDWKVTMWANVTAPRGLNELHSHPGNLWAAVLYIDMGVSLIAGLNREEISILKTRAFPWRRCITRALGCEAATACLRSIR